MTATTERAQDSASSDTFLRKTTPARLAKHMDPAFQAYALLHATFVTASS